ncbi:hypothetical protein HYT56_03830 [Candidatus Woesearchaeota archaeon]|nr:hypothetical protein [Candidatus Woesearchaeota archaeon]
MKNVIIENEINGKVVRCVFIFKNYSRKNFKDDFDEFILLQTKEKKVGDFIEYPLYNVSEFTEIPYEYFIEYGPKLFSKVIFDMIRKGHDFIFSDELNIQISFRRVKDLEFYFETVDDAINAENACFIGAGIWFLINIVAPFFYFKKINASIIIRFFLHELTHYIDLVQDYFSWDKKYEGKIRNIVGRKSAYGINYLYNSLFNLREEGLAEFATRSQSPEIDVNGGAAKTYNSNLEKLAFIRYKKDASKFYFNNISHGNQTSTGEYSIGRNMCLFIALSIAKEINSSFSIRTGKEKISGAKCYDLLDKDLSKGITFYVSDIPKEIINIAITKIKPTIHYYFLKEYEKACDVLEISEKNRAMTQRGFYKLVKKAKKASTKQTKKLIEKEGFVFVQSDLQLF